MRQKRKSPECDLDFWEDIEKEDFEEVENNVRYSFAIYEPIS